MQMYRDRMHASVVSVNTNIVEAVAGVPGAQKKVNELPGYAKGFLYFTSITPGDAPVLGSPLVTHCLDRLFHPKLKRILAHSCFLRMTKRRSPVNSATATNILWDTSYDLIFGQM